MAILGITVTDVVEDNERHYDDDFVNDDTEQMTTATTPNDARAH